MHAMSSLDQPHWRHLLWLPVLLYGASVLAFAVNVPVGDDHVVLDTLTDLHSVSDLRGWFDRILAPHNEHRIVTTRLIAYAFSRLPDGIDFRALIFVGNAALLGSLWVLGGLLGLGRRSAARAVLVLIVLQPQPHKLMFYPMAIIGAYGGLLFSMAYLHFTLKRGKEYIAPLFLAGTVLTTGAGIFLIVLGTLALALRRRWTPLVVHLAVAVALAGWYFHAVRPAETQIVAFALRNPLVLARMFLGLLGGIAEFPSYQLGWISNYTTVATGTVLLIYSGVIAQRTLRKGSQAGDTDLALLLCLLYGLMTIALITLNRAPLYKDVMLIATLDGRYRIYGLLVAALCMIDCLQQLDSRQLLTRRLLGSVMACALIFNVGWYAYRADTMGAAALARTVALQIWLRTGDTSELPSWALEPEIAGRILHRATAAGVFRPASP